VNRSRLGNDAQRPSRTASNGNDASQTAGANAATTQDNANAPIADLTSANTNNGPVSQGNTARTQADGQNANGTTQRNDQLQGGPLVGPPRSQTASNDNATTQGAGAGASASQSNTRAPNAFFDGQDSSNGATRQRNDAATSGVAANGNETSQRNQQGQLAPVVHRPEDNGKDPSQSASNRNVTTQTADATPQTAQSNSNVPFADFSRNVDNGNVDQGNAGTNAANARNRNGTDQANGQVQSTGPLDQSQTAANDNRTTQTASSSGDLRQGNTNWPNGPVAIGDTNSNNGDVSQRNRGSVSGDTQNGNGTRQANGQAQGGGAPAVTQSQSATNRNATDQTGSAAGRAEQSSTRMPSGFGKADSNNGDVEQSNAAAPTAGPRNLNGTQQSNRQRQQGGSAPAAMDQKATNDNQVRQDAPTSASATQQNTASPMADGSQNSNNGNVRQTNPDPGARAVGSNVYATQQSNTQRQPSGAGTAPQEAQKTDQTTQQAPAQATKTQSNEHAPVAGPVSGANNGNVDQRGS
jgi:hypothetical protein